MSKRVIVLLLGVMVVLGGCKSRNVGTSVAKIGSMKDASITQRAGARRAPDPSYDPIFDPRNHDVRAQKMRRYPHANLTEWKDRSRDGFGFANIIADHGNHYQLDTGDIVRIDVFEQANLSRLYRIDGGGFVSMPLVGAVAARGLTTRSLEQEVAEKLRQSYVRDPKVTVEISTHRPFFILGEVRHSGKFPYELGMTVETAVAIAGGYSPRANQKKAMVIRRIGGRLVRAYVPNHYQIRPGDTLKVVERLF